MPVETRTWPYGTSKLVDVVRVEDALVVAEETVGGQKHGYLMIGAAHLVEPTEGSVATIVFRAGGPTGGYWRVEKVHDTHREQGHCYVHALASRCASENRWPREAELDQLAKLTGKAPAALRMVVAMLGDDVARGHLEAHPCFEVER